MYVEFMKNFFLTDSSELMGVRVISVSWAQKHLIPNSRHDVRRVHSKFFSRLFAPTDGCYSHFGLLSPKTFDSHFLCTWCTSSSWKTFFSPIRANWWVLESFRSPEPKNVWFPLSRHDVRRVHSKFFSRRFERTAGVRVISASWAQKRLIRTF